METAQHGSKKTVLGCVMQLAVAWLLGEAVVSCL